MGFYHISMVIAAAVNTAADQSSGVAVGKAVGEAVGGSLIPSHQIAKWVMKFIRQTLDFIGLNHDQKVEEICYTIVIAAVAIFLGILLRRATLFLVRKVVRLRHSQAADLMLKMRVPSRCSHIIPPILFLCLIPFAFSTDPKTLDWILRIVGVYTLITFGMAISALLEYGWQRFDEKENTENHPLKGVLNILRGVLWIIIAIVAVSVIIDKSPLTLLAGLGAFAAALMLIFKDSILGFVAGIQLSDNDMLRVGDWITVPGTIANGIVQDVTLTVVKVQNFDNTMVMIPPYSLVSTSFQNWRNMFKVGARMIDHNIFIDHSSIHAIDADFASQMAEKFPLLKDFVENQEKLKTASGEPIFAQEYNNTHGINGTVDTNLGLFRAYVCAFLMGHPLVNSQNQDMLISMDPPQAYGVALNINCYSKMTGWGQFEAVKAEILEHIHATAGEFGLKVYNNPDRNDFRIAATVENNAAPAGVSK